MIVHTKAFERLRNEAQRYLNLVVATCHAIPALRKQLAAAKKDPVAHPLTPPDYFKLNYRGLDNLEQQTLGYERELANATIITLFSHFEAYVKDAISEIVQFHGGPDEFIGRAEERARQHMKTLTAQMKQSKRKLQEPEKAANLWRYKKHSRELSENGFRFPTELMSSYGVRVLVEKASDDRRKELKAWEIPDVLQNALHLPLTPAAVRRYEQIRKKRNEIGHGNPSSSTIEEAMQISTDLRELAKTIDGHVVEHFLVLEKYAR